MGLRNCADPRAASKSIGGAVGTRAFRLNGFTPRRAAFTSPSPSRRASARTFTPIALLIAVAGNEMLLRRTGEEEGEGGG